MLETILFSGIIAAVPVQEKEFVGFIELGLGHVAQIPFMPGYQREFIQLGGCLSAVEGIHVGGYALLDTQPRESSPLVTGASIELGGTSKNYGSLYGIAQFEAHAEGEEDIFSTSFGAGFKQKFPMENTWGFSVGIGLLYSIVNISQEVNSGVSIISTINLAIPIKEKSI